MNISGKKIEKFIKENMGKKISISWIEDPLFKKIKRNYVGLVARLDTTWNKYHKFAEQFKKGNIGFGKSFEIDNKIFPYEDGNNLYNYQNSHHYQLEMLK